MEPTVGGTGTGTGGGTKRVVTATESANPSAAGSAIDGTSATPTMLRFQSLTLILTLPLTLDLKRVDRIEYFRDF